MSRRASSLAFHAIAKPAEVSTVSHHPSLCVRRGGGGASASTVSRIPLVKDSAISEILLGCKGRSGSLKNDPRNYSLPATSVRSKLLPVERLDLFFCTYASVGRSTTAEADQSVHDVMV